jgi:hypothetical protein
MIIMSASTAMSFAAAGILLLTAKSRAEASLSILIFQSIAHSFATGLILQLRGPDHFCLAMAG